MGWHGGRRYWFNLSTSVCLSTIFYNIVIKLPFFLFLLCMQIGGLSWLRSNPSVSIELVGYLFCAFLTELVTMYYYSNYLRVVYDGIQSECHRQNANVWNATDICVWGLGVGIVGLGWAFFVLGSWAMAFLSLAFCPEIVYDGYL